MGLWEAHPLFIDDMERLTCFRSGLPFLKYVLCKSEEEKNERDLLRLGMV